MCWVGRGARTTLASFLTVGGKLIKHALSEAEILKGIER